MTELTGWMISEAAVRSVLRSALSDPGSIVPRHVEFSVYEPLTHWQVRAALTALSRAGWMITAAPVEGAETDAVDTAGHAAVRAPHVLGRRWS